jgi:hypothetical protein
LLALETAVPLHATALLQVFATDPEVQRWLEETWWRTKVAHGREARAYIEATWPEFDWCGAYAGFYDAYRPLVCAARDSRGPAREALVRSVAAAQASAFYRCLGNTSDHAGLRSMLHRMAADESVHFAGFRRLFARLEHNNRFGLLMAYKTIVDCAQRARDVDVRAIMYADRMTGSMERAIAEMDRRRAIQVGHNEAHGITPGSIVKSLEEVRLSTHVADARTENPAKPQRPQEVVDLHDPAERAAYVAKLERRMQEAAANLEFERAALLRDELNELRAAGAPDVHRSHGRARRHA